MHGVQDEFPSRRRRRIPRPHNPILAGSKPRPLADTRQALAAVLGLSFSVATADDVKSGPTTKIGGPFDVKAITGEKAGKTLCYVCKYNGEDRPAVVLIFTRKADDNLVSVVKAVDEVQKTNKDLGTVVVGVGGVQAADFEKIQTTHKLTTPLTVAEDKVRELI